MAKPNLKIVRNEEAKAMAKLSEDRIGRFGMVIIKGIEADVTLRSVPYFTRETLLIHFRESPAFGRVSTITRYGMIREAVKWLEAKGLLVRPNESRINLCLPKYLKRARDVMESPVPLHLRYYPLILEILRQYPAGDNTDVMTVVNYWIEYYEGGVPLTEDNMRVLVRHTMKSMAHHGLLTENNDYTYRTNETLYESAVL